MPDTFIAATAVGRSNDQFAPAGPLARLKSSSTGVDGPTPPDDATTAVAADCTGPAEPAMLLAVTATRRVEPTSAAVSAYV